MDSALHGVGALQITENDIIASGVELYRPLSLEVSLAKGRTIPIRPLNLSSTGPLEFTIAPTGNSYVQLHSTRLYLKLKVQTAAGDDLAAAVQVGTINNLVNSLFQSCEIEINGKAMTGLSNNDYNYKSYLENLLSYSPAASQSHILSGGWAIDTAGQFETKGARNLGYTTRKSWIAESKSVDFMTPLASDFFNTDRMLPPGVQVTVRLNCASPSFVFLSEAVGPHKFVFEKAILYVRHVDVSPIIVKRHETQLRSKNALLPINRCVIKKFAFAAGLSQAFIPNAFTGTLPKSLVVGMVTQTALNGTETSNPYNFQHFDVQYASIRVNGEEVPAEPYKPDFAAAAPLVTREYRDLFDNIGIGSRDLANGVTLPHFKAGCTLFAYDLSPDLCNGYHFHPKQSGNLDINLSYGTAFAAPMYVVTMATYDAYVTIDKHGNADVNISV